MDSRPAALCPRIKEDKPEREMGRDGARVTRMRLTWCAKTYAALLAKKSYEGEAERRGHPEF
jgi:hypothetical protein